MLSMLYYGLTGFLVLIGLIVFIDWVNRFVKGRETMDGFHVVVSGIQPSYKHKYKLIEMNRVFLTANIRVFR